MFQGSEVSDQRSEVSDQRSGNQFLTLVAGSWPLAAGL